MELVILIGIQASGKSSFCKERLFDTHIRLNLDMLKTRHREQLLFQACLEAKQRVVIDNTNSTARDRAKYIKAAKRAGFRITGYYFRSVLEECLKRNERRTDQKIIPFKGILATYNKLELPKASEGFDELFYVRLRRPRKFEVCPFSENLMK